MQRKFLTPALAIAGAIGFGAALPSFAQYPSGHADTNTGGATQSRSGNASTDTMGARSSHSTTAAGATERDSAAAASGQSFDKTGQGAWAEAHAKRNNGRISREAYMDEMSRRWDAVDHDRQGLTPAEVSRLYGNVDSAAGPARTGSGVQAGNMGPGNSKGQ